MLQVGNVGLSQSEQIAHFSLWALMAAPLLIATDLRTLDNASLAILLNREVIALNQDSLGVQGVRVSPSNTTGAEVWAKPLTGGSVAIIFLNRGDAEADIPTTWNQVGFEPNVGSVRDVWLHAPLPGTYSGGYTAKQVAGHSIVMLTVSKPAQQLTVDRTN